MAISRSGPTPAFLNYLLNAVLLPASAPPSPAVLALQTPDFRWIYVPSYQRGISWGVSEVEEFLDSDSILLGSVILASFPHDGTAEGAFFHHQPSTYDVLVDGLQRLAVGTALLRLLHDRVLAPSPGLPQEVQHFQVLISQVQSRAGAYLHNDQEFLHHPRKAIADQYASVKADLEKWMTSEFAEGRGLQLGQRITSTLVEKQVALDEYFNFPGPLELMNTFLGLNTVRVDLGPIDLLRAMVVEKASSDGWSAGDVEDIENAFTQIFAPGDSPDRELMPLVKIVLEALRSGEASLVFPSWGQGLLEGEVEEFLQFTSDFKALSGNGYMDEIRACGSLPFAMVVAYYYHEFLRSGGLPSVLSGGSGEDAVLHELLRACYRVLLEGQIGRTRKYAESALRGAYSSLSDLASALSSDYLGVALGGNVANAWIETTTGRVDRDRSRAKRIFNAMRLPERSQVQGSTFEPLGFGRRVSEFHVDHLIPDAFADSNRAGYEESQSIRNFAPLPSSENKAAKATSCGAKLAQGGLYSGYLANGQWPNHAYCEWLVQTHAVSQTPASLDSQELLVQGASTGVGDERLAYIVDALAKRL